MSQTSQEKLNMCVNYTLQSGIRPMEVLFRPVYDCFFAEPVAYMALVRINSIIAGVLDAQDYLEGNADEELLNEFTFRAIEKTLQAKKKLENAAVKLKLLYIRCPASLIYVPNLYERLKLILAERGDGESKLCLCFDGAVMETESTKLCQAFSDIRSAGLKIAVSGYGGRQFPIEKLLHICPDHLFADESLAELSLDREKRRALPPLINLAKSFGGEVIACGICSDEQLREFRSRECFGFLPEQGYRGAFSVKWQMLTIDELISDGGENDKQ